MNTGAEVVINDPVLWTLADTAEVRVNVGIVEGEAFQCPVGTNSRVASGITSQAVRENEDIRIPEIPSAHGAPDGSGVPALRSMDQETSRSGNGRQGSQRCGGSTAPYKRRGEAMVLGPNRNRVAHGDIERSSTQRRPNEGAANGSGQEI